LRFPVRILRGHTLCFYRLARAGACCHLILVTGVPVLRSLPTVFPSHINGARPCFLPFLRCPLSPCFFFSICGFPLARYKGDSFFLLIVPSFFSFNRLSLFLFLSLFFMDSPCIHILSYFSLMRSSSFLEAPPPRGFRTAPPARPFYGKILFSFFSSPFKWRGALNQLTRPLFREFFFFPSLVRLMHCLFSPQCLSLRFFVTN